MNVCVEFDFVVVGEVSLGADENLRFPSLPAMPAVYRFRLLGQSSSISTYIGETDNLRRRAYHYRSPGPSQPTNIRLHGRIHSHLHSGGAVEFATITEARVTVGASQAALDLSQKSHRLLLENAALVANPRGELIENLP